ncbi:MAG: PQQ-binding-like beta-propeller repeat protein [Candidatus Micrarchaeota archaeon]
MSWFGFNLEKSFLFLVLAVLLIFAFGGCVQSTQPSQLGFDAKNITDEKPIGQRPGDLEPHWQPQKGDPNQTQYPDVQSQNQPPKQDFRIPNFDPNASLPQPPTGFPESKLVSKNMGETSVSYFTTAIARDMMESGTDYFITLRNNGNNKARICFRTYGELREFVPSWNLHFFELQDSPIELRPGEQKKLWYFASLDQKGDFTVDFELWPCENEQSKLIIPVVFGSTDERFWGKETSYVYGIVTDEQGNPVKDAMVVAIVGCGRTDFKGQTDQNGKYVVPLLGMEDIEAIYMGRELGCSSEAYKISIDKEGYGYYFRENVSVTRKNPLQFDIMLKKGSEQVEYEMQWEKKVSDNYGFFWVKPSEDWSVFAATQAKHPPELGKPTNFYLFDSNGNILWKQPTGNECWGIDIAKDGSKVVAGCHDGFIYSVDKSGKLLWKYDSGTMIRSACISNNGRTVLSGPLGNLYLFDSTTGTRKDVPRSGDWLRNCAFHQDDSGFVVGSREMGEFDSLGNQKWEYVIGEFPLFMAVDSDKNTYATGKSRIFFSFDKNGKLRWTHKITEPTITAGAATPDGDRIAAGSVGGSVYLFAKNGTLLWQRGAISIGEFGAVGHNAIAISEDGTRIVAGTAPNNCIMVYDESGTTIWNNCITPDSSNKDLILGVTNVQISKDKKKIIASYGDNYIRMFVLKE